MVVVGAGHNALIAAAYLAREGHEVTVLERADRPGGAVQSNVMHLEKSLDQMFMFRPLPELSSYTTPLRGLYLTGAGTHPGGGVFGASGRNAARVMLKAL